MQRQSFFVIFGFKCGFRKLLVETPLKIRGVVQKIRRIVCHSYSVILEADTARMHF